MMVADRAEINQRVLDTPAKSKAALSKRNTHLYAPALQTQHIRQRSTVLVISK